MSDLDTTFLEAADRIGRRLCRDAVWAGRRCNWLGWALVPSRQGWVDSFCAQDPTLYGGTAGIALFLASLFRWTGDPVERATLLGAIAQLRDGPEESTPADSFGFHSGRAGMAYALIRVGDLLDDEASIHQGLELLSALASREPDPKRLDVIGGSAGTIPVLLGAAARFGRDDLAGSAAAHGDLLISTAVRSDRGWSWDTLGHAGAPHLLGYAHGAGGIACALLELHRATGEERFREAAEEALRYERGHFDAAASNWPDLRVSVASPANSAAPPQHPVAWCHGAPGVGCSRLRVRALSTSGDDPELEAEIRVAVETTNAALPVLMALDRGNFSLCHGAAGCGDFLLLASQELERPDLRQVAETVGRAGEAYYHRNDLPWPCGLLTRRETPNLMLGLAGIGYFFLRLHSAREVPSVLIVAPEDLALSAPGWEGRERVSEQLVPA